ncbi:MAG TPA: formimidoylglutamate deiminase [Pyrinomonadaceae bacterium]|nr:formimidoylglutamate deiminase [Pyrinomonadaceae bacterium]
MNDSPQAWLPELIYTGKRFQPNLALTYDPAGNIVLPVDPDQNVVRLKNRALLPGLVNAHSHAFQRVIRGRTEHRTTDTSDSFWTWREMMYSAATRLTPEDIYDASRMAFMEMTLSGITTVGEFHYLHNQPDGSQYDDPNLLAKEVVRAARDVGLRIALLRVAYARAGYQVDSNPRQARFVETDPDLYLTNLAKLRADLTQMAGEAWVGIAPHSVRAVPLNYLKSIVEFATRENLMVHMHVAEQPAEVLACIEEHARSPVSLLETEGLLSDRFTGIHVIHLKPNEVQKIATSGAMVCACPTTERNLGDGIVPMDLFLAENISVSLGTDSQAEIDLLEDARELEYHLRLQRLERAVLSKSDDDESALAVRLFDCATINGARSLGMSRQLLQPGSPADFFTIDLDDPSVAGATADSLISTIVFSLNRTAIKDVVVGGKCIVQEGRHFAQDEITSRYIALQQRLWH